ncbi:MAG TPA: tetratricopeptide repeat protein [Vicinamibacterales bacterium]|nr:tetratricopeptide repeat protein [Vicinamibacterales bacterium]
MRSLSGSAAAAAGLALGAFALVSTSGCAKMNEVKAMRSYKEANKTYQAQDYKKAAEMYKATIDAAPDDDRVTPAYFFYANSLDNEWKPSKKGDPANDKLLDTAVENYQKAAERLRKSDNADYKKLGKLSLQYLVAAYGTDKLNDPAKAEPVLIDMINQDPTDTTLYTQLAKLYEDAGAYDNAEQVLLRAKNTHPDSGVYMTLAAFYNREGQFDKTMEALNERAQKEPNNPEAFYTMATFYWDEAYRDFKLKDAQKREFVQKGMDAVDHALQIKPDYIDALVYKGLLLRLQANLEPNPDKQKDLIKQAEQLSEKANQLRKQKAAGQ